MEHDGTSLSWDRSLGVCLQCGAHIRQQYGSIYLVELLLLATRGGSGSQNVQRN